MIPLYLFLSSLRDHTTIQERQIIMMISRSAIFEIKFSNLKQLQEILFLRNKITYNLPNLLFISPFLGMTISARHGIITSH